MYTKVSKVKGQTLVKFNTGKGHVMIISRCFLSERAYSIIHPLGDPKAKFYNLGQGTGVAVGSRDH